ncbi:Membrane protein involved in the export of O-antigen and teichoic acid [Natronoarchaeum philippinense]|uniref:Membrane protein involved in the export of O-antigen and teichoic acid n=1 Tax=Natronoarchaeum philippinense TaxID=558529 RepID=A0A285NGK0_NATPI|nr:oligosaccharide flippase family protein [Natronoarchaeum philippinense]SNZ06771.1 Membrane protein involved in the export of O-antigen and teichoic acid [Natronoarchaeum philippinense]
MADSGPGDMKLGLEVLKGFGGKLLQAVLGFVGTILFARALGPRSFGGFYLLLSLVMLANRPIMGIAVATKKRFAELNANRSEIFGAQLVFNVAIFSTAAIVVFLLADPIESYTGVSHSAALFVILFGSILTFAPTQELVAGRGKVSAPVWIDTLRSVFTFPLQLALVLLGFGAAGMVFGLSIATLLCVPITLYYLRTSPSAPGWETLTSVWKFARYSIGSRLVGRAYDELDPLLLGFLLTPSVVGYYQVAYRLTIPGTFVTVIASSGLLAKVSNRDSKGQGIDADVTNTAAFGSIIAVPMFFGALAIPEPLIVTAYSAEYIAATELLVGLALFTIVRTQSALLGDVLNGLEMPNIVLRGSAVALVINVAVGVPATLEYGPIGVVVATILAEVFRYGVFFFVVRSETSATLLPRPLFEQFGAGVVMFGVVELAHQQIVVDSWVPLLALLAIGAGVYFVTLGAISNLFRTTVRSLLQDVRHDIS